MTDLPNDPLALAGTTIAEKYQVERLVAEGGFSLVYRANHLLWKQPVVLKFLKILQGVGPGERDEMMAGLLREGALLRELSSRTASILQAHDVGTWASPGGEVYPYLVLEWLDGMPLSDAIEQEKARGKPPLALPELVRLFEPVARALAVVHKRNIAHRDIKPDNLFLSGDLRDEEAFIKVLDFGVAKVISDMSSRMAATAQTNLAGLSFTPWYGAPEQFSRAYGATGPWTDVFSLALVLVELLTFERPLGGVEVAELAVESTHPTLRPTPRSKGLPISDELEAVFARALAVNPANRYPTAGEFWSDLRKAMGLEVADAASLNASVSRPPPSFVGSLPPPVSHPTMTSPGSRPITSPAVSRSAPPPPRGQPAWLWGLVGACTLITVGGGAMLLGMKVQPSSPGASPRALASAAPSAPVVASAAPEPACPAGMVKIPGGDFYMGFDGEEAMDSEKPQHPVKLAPFCVDVTEVTVEAYRACSDAGKCPRAGTDVQWPGLAARERKIYGPLCNVDDPGRDKHPINCVDWEMAENFCKRSGKRLPTSAEWEFAVRGPDGRIYPWGDEPPDANHLNACGKECLDWGKKNGVFDLTAMHNQDDGFPTTAPVGSFPKGRSRYGLDDVIGNVMEWVHDWDGPYDKAPSVNPAGPEKGTERVIRGGAWNAGHKVWVRPSFRFKFPPETRSHGVGFRCAADLAASHGAP